jgi:hypothetical protein
MSVETLPVAVGPADRDRADRPAEAPVLGGVARPVALDAPCPTRSVHAGVE